MRCCAHGGFALCVLHTAEPLLPPSSPLQSLTRSLWQWHSQALHTTNSYVCKITMQHKSQTVDAFAPLHVSQTFEDYEVRRSC